MYEDCKTVFLFFLRFMFLRLFLYFCSETRIKKKAGCAIASDRSSCLQMFFKTDDLKKLAVFTRKHLCLSLFLIKLL